MGTSTKKRQYQLFHKGPNIRSTLSKTSVSGGKQMHVHNPAHAHTYTNLHKHTARYTGARLQSQSTEGITIFPPSARLDKIKLFSFSHASFLLSNAGFSNNTRFYCGPRIIQQISNSCQMRCDRIQWLFSHSARGGPRRPLTLAAAKLFMSPIQQLHRPASVNTTVSF